MKDKSLEKVNRKGKIKDLISDWFYYFLNILLIASLTSFITVSFIIFYEKGYF